jgi:PAS domain S-box-containing protein
MQTQTPISDCAPAATRPAAHVFRRVARACAVVVAGLGLAALAGWLTGWREAAGIRPDYIPMAPNTGLALLAFGAALWPLAQAPPPRGARWFAGALAAVVAVVATLRLYELAAVLRLNTDRWVLPTPPGKFGLAPLGEMSYPTALGLEAAAAAVLLLAVRGRPGWSAVACGLAVLAGGALFSLGYLYGAPFFYGATVIPMALTTALGFTALGAGLLAAAGPEAPVLCHFCGPTAYARLLRAFLPLTAVVFGLVSWVIYTVGHRSGPASAALVSGGLVLAIIFLVSLVSARLAHLVGSDLEWAEQELRLQEGQTRAYAAELEAANASLERRIAERTAALADAAQVERQAREALQESEARFRAVSESANDAVISADGDGNIIHWNQGARIAFGHTAEEVLGKPLTLLMPARFRDAHSRGLERVRRTGEAQLIGQTIEVVGLRKDGREFPMDLSLSAWDTHDGKFFSGIARDISARKRAEEQLRLRHEQLQEAAESERRAHAALKQAQSQMVQTEKLAALGQLVAGVAHEINNPMSLVSNNVAVFQRDVRALRDVLRLYRRADALLARHQPDLHAAICAQDEAIDLTYTLDHLDDLAVRARDGLKRIQQIVKDLRDFARLDESDLQEADLRAGIDSTLHIIRSRAKKQEVELVAELAPLPPVTCYPAKVNQVVLNLVANAIDACPPGGTVTVRTAARDSGVEIHVLDTGTGIAPAVRDKVFDPFFTTKPPGQGTGLGLSISYQIVQDHGGTIAFDSEPGKGTHFVVFFPYQPPVAGSAKGR